MERESTDLRIDGGMDRENTDLRTGGDRGENADLRTGGAEERVHADLSVLEGLGQDVIETEKGI